MPGLNRKSAQSYTDRVEAAISGPAPAAAQPTPNIQQARRNITPILNPSPSELAARGSLRNTSGLVGTARLPGYGRKEANAETFVEDGYISGQRNFKNGGKVKGPGTGTSDSIKANLSNGEYVVKASSAKKIGDQALHEMNKTGVMPRMSRRFAPKARK